MYEIGAENRPFRYWSRRTWHPSLTTSKTPAARLMLDLRSLAGSAFECSGRRSEMAEEHPIQGGGLHR